MKHTKKEIHVLYIITKLELGGAQKICVSLFNELPQHRIITHLLTGAEGALLEKVRSSSNVYFTPQLVRECSAFSVVREIRCFFSLIRIIRLLRKKQPDIMVHTHSTKAGLLGRWAALFAGVKVRIHTIHGYAFHAYQSIFVWFIIYFLELVTSFITSHYVCVSSADAKTGTDLFPGFAHKHSIIRAAVDTDQFYQPAQKTEWPETPHQLFIFGTIACFKPQKNLFDLLTAFLTVYRSNSRVRLELLGDGILRKSIEEWIAAHQLERIITLHGWQQDVTPYMKQWHTFVLSSLWEGLPCAIVEARLMGIPVISYRTGGIADVITHDHNGLLVAPKDVPSLAHHMLQLASEKDRWKQFAFQDKSVVHAFNNAHMAHDHRDLYRHLL